MSRECEEAAARCESAGRQRLVRERSELEAIEQRKRAVEAGRVREAEQAREREATTILREVPLRIPQEISPLQDPRTPTFGPTCPSRF